MNKRRQVIQKIGLSSIWVTPIVQSVMLPAHAETSECSTTPVPCPPIVFPGIVVMVVDNQTNENISNAATVTVTEGSYTEVLSNQGTSHSGALERPGTYNILVTAPGYVDLSLTNVVVETDCCNVITENIEARMVRAP